MQGSFVTIQKGQIKKGWKLAQTQHFVSVQVNHPFPTLHLVVIVISLPVSIQNFGTLSKIHPFHCAHP